MLAILLVATSLAATVTGLVLKAQLQKYVGGWEDRLAIAVPFMLLHDNTDLRRMEQARQAGSTPNQPEQPENPTAPEAPDESKIPTDTETPAQPEKPQVPGVPTELPDVVPGAKYGEDESFFDDALFIGDSRMVSSAYYARLGKADYFTDVGMNVFQMFSVTASDDNFDATDLTTLLQNRTYKKIFIMLGINECGYPMSSLLSAYQEDIDTLKRLQPDATIYLLKVYGVSRSVAAKGELSLSFKKKLEDRLDIPVYLQDERLTTREAEAVLISNNTRRNNRKKVIDSLAATIILQSYLDKEKKL